MNDRRIEVLRLLTSLAVLMTVVAYVQPPPFARAATAFANTRTITIPRTGTKGVADPYPSAVTVDGLGSATSRVSVTLHNLTHTYPDDLDILLVGPTGASALLMSDHGGSFGVNAVTLTCDDRGATGLPNSTQIVSGTYRLSRFGETCDPFPVPAPADWCEFGTSLAVFNGTDPNGVWHIFVVDDENADNGELAGGWSLMIETADAAPSRPIKPDQKDSSRTKTEEQRQQDQRTNRSNRSDVVTEGNVVSVTSGPDGLTIVIGNVDGLVTIVLPCGSACPTIRPGDYVEVEGEKVHEQLYQAQSVTVVR